MKKLILLSFAIFLATCAMGQNPVKGFKALDGGDYATAKTIFTSLLKADENDVAANFGMSRYFGIEKTGEKNKFKALEYLEKAEAQFPYDDEKAQAKFKKSGVTRLALETRRERIENSLLEDVKAANTLEAYESFLQRFPESKAIVAATNYRNKKAYSQVLEVNSVEALDLFITTYPEADEIKKAVPLRNKMASEVALKTNTVAAYQHFLTKYPDAPQAPQMTQRLNAVAFEDAKSVGTVAAYEAYIKNYPESIFIPQAKDKLDFLKSNEEN